ncbi:MAG: YbaK/EbsC family protein [Thermodesulfobacteriales bacterium]|nr:MAG: YbaK/EbsC family protein [Thermodesulfobacteriales bacterium]
MSVLNKLKESLDEKNIKYISIYHSPAYTGQELAESVHISGKEIAKTVILKAGGGYMMAVLPASRKINFDYLEEQIAAKGCRLAEEDEIKNLFPDCEVGAMPPFGNIYDMPVYAASALSEDEEIVFNAGTHTDAIRMGYNDYIRLVDPHVINFSEPVN